MLEHHSYPFFECVVGMRMVGWLDQVRIKQTLFLNWSNWGKDQVERFVGPTHIACKLLFWKYIPSFLFIIWPDLWPFWPFWASYTIFRGQGQVQKLSWDLLI